MSDFEKRRIEQGEARRARAAERDAERQDALSAGARAPSRVDGDPGSAARTASVLLGVGAAVLVLLGVVLWGSLFGGLAFGGAVALGAGAFAARRYAGTAGAIRAGEEQRLAALAGSLTAGTRWEQAHARAVAAVNGSELDAAKRSETVAALDAALAEVKSITRLAGSDPRATERQDAFVARCDQVATLLARAPAADAPSAVVALDELAAELEAETAARAELEEELRRARGGSTRQTS